jgi:hypothetical protein
MKWGRVHKSHIIDEDTGLDNTKVGSIHGCRQNGAIQQHAFAQSLCASKYTIVHIMEARKVTGIFSISRRLMPIVMVVILEGQLPQAP